MFFLFCQCFFLNFCYVFFYFKNIFVLFNVMFLLLLNR